VGGRRTHLNACLRSLGQPVMACATLRAWMKSKESSLCVHGCSASSYEADVICDIEVGEGGIRLRICSSAEPSLVALDYRIIVSIRSVGE